MSRVFPVLLLALALCAFVGCGGGDATDSGVVAENSGGAAPATGDGAAMPSSGAGMGTPESAGMGSSGGEGMMSAAGGAGMDESMYAGTATDAADPAAGMYMEGYTNPAEGGADATSDAAEMAAAYGGAPGSTEGISPEEMQANYAGAGADSAYPGGANPAAAYPGGANAAGPDGAEAYSGTEYPGGPGGPGGPGNGAVEEKVPDGFDGKAQLAFRRGKDQDAMQYLYAHALTNDAGAESILPTIRWVSGLREPTLAVRWGVGFIVTAPRNFNGDPKPVGSQQTIPTREGNRKGGGGNEGYVGGGGGADYGAGGGGGGGSTSLLSKGAGELGDKLAAAYTERVKRGDFGDVLKKALEGSSGGKRGNSDGNDASDYGAEGGAGYGAAMGAGGPGGGGGEAAGAAAATKVSHIMPGLSMLGIGTQKELIERAREEGIVAVVIIDVKIRVSPSSNLVTNDSTLALLDVKTQKKLHTTRAFNNIAIQQARADEKEDNVDKELDKLFEAIDANFTMTDLPEALNAEVVTRRLASLTASASDNPLPVLAEARMYHAKGMLEESALFALYEQVLGVDSGRLMSTGSEEDKQKALDRWLPEL